MSAIEDAEALSVYLRHATADAGSVHAALMQTFRVRFKRASECQRLSHANSILHERPGGPDNGRDVLRIWGYGGAERWAAERPEMILNM
jgi:hypothetical protein